jgi:ribosome-binding protein aMBF1 (putative translation factor)
MSEIARHRPGSSGAIIMAQAAKNTKSNGLDREFLTDLGEVVRKRRLALNLSQEELASRAGVHRTYLSDIERGARNITVTVLARIAEALEVRVSRLFRLTEDNGYEQPKRSR